MLNKGSMLKFKKMLGYLIGIIGISLIVSKEKTLSLVVDTGFFINNFYFSILAILLIIISYFLIIAGRRL